MREKITSLTFGTFPLKNKTKNEGEDIVTIVPSLPLIRFTHDGEDNLTNIRDLPPQKQDEE
jgi:hypothetical protein